MKKLQLFQTDNSKRKGQYHILNSITNSRYGRPQPGDGPYIHAYCSTSDYTGKAMPPLLAFNNQLELCVTCVQNAYKEGVINVIEGPRKSASD